MPEQKTFSSADLGFDQPKPQTFSSKDLGFDRPKVSKEESAFRGFAQGASLGWADEATAGAGALRDYVQGKMGMRGPISLSDAYGTYIDRVRAQDDVAKADNPTAFKVGTVGGGILSAVAPGATALNSVKGAAAMGAVTGAGLSEANPLKSPDAAKEFAMDVGGGALTGAAFQKGFQLLGKGASKFTPTELRNTANIKTLKAAGYMGPELKQMSEVEKQAAGEALDRLGIVRAFDSLDQVASKATAAKQKAGGEIGAALDSVDDLVKQAHKAIDEGRLGGALPPAGKENLKAAVDKQFQFNMGRIGQRIEKELIGPNARNPLLKGELSKLQGLADDFKAGGSLSMREGNVIKGTQGKVTNFNSETVPQTFKQEVYDIIKNEIDDIVGKTGNLEAGVARSQGRALGASDVAGRNKSIADAFSSAKKDYGIAKETADIAQRRLGQTQGNREISLTDTIAAAGGLATGNPAAPLLLGGFNKLARQYSDSVLASTARAAARAMEKSPKVLGEFAGVLEAAARRGVAALNSTHLSLLRDPEYRRILSEYEEPSNPMQRRLQGH